MKNVAESVVLWWACQRVTMCIWWVLFFCQPWQTHSQAAFVCLLHILCSWCCQSSFVRSEGYVLLLPQIHVSGQSTWKIIYNYVGHVYPRQQEVRVISWAFCPQKHFYTVHNTTRTEYCCPSAYREKVCVQLVAQMTWAGNIQEYYVKEIRIYKPDAPHIFWNILSKDARVLISSLSRTMRSILIPTVSRPHSLHNFLTNSTYKRNYIFSRLLIAFTSIFKRVNIENPTAHTFWLRSSFRRWSLVTVSSEFSAGALDVWIFLYSVLSTTADLCVLPPIHGAQYSKEGGTLYGLFLLPIQKNNTLGQT